MLFFTIIYYPKKNINRGDNKIKDNANTIIIDLLKRPFEFRKSIRKFSYLSMYKGDTPTKQEVIKDINETHFKDIFKGLLDEDIYGIFLKFEKKTEIKKNWILNSNVRAKTFYYLGNQEKITATEIAKLISKHPKSVSTYLSEFKNKSWVEEPEEVGREKKYFLSELGLSYFELALFKGWFSGIITKEPVIEEIVLRLSFTELIPKEQSIYSDPERQTDYFDSFENEYIYESPPPPEFPPLYELISDILTIITSMQKKLMIEIKIPEIIEIGEDDMISINTTNDDIIALIFAAFNYMKKNKLKLHKYWEINQIKLITVDSYFDAEMQEIDEGFMTKEETEIFIKKILNKFRKKIKERRNE